MTYRDALACMAIEPEPRCWKCGGRQATDEDTRRGYSRGWCVDCGAPPEPPWVLPPEPSHFALRRRRHRKEDDI